MSSFNPPSMVCSFDFQGLLRNVEEHVAKMMRFRLFFFAESLLRSSSWASYEGVCLNVGYTRAYALYTHYIPTVHPQIAASCSEHDDSFTGLRGIVPNF